jgi:hypothetical protein
MNKKLKEKLDSWDLKSAILTIAFLSIALFALVYFTGFRERIRRNKIDEFKGQATGEILSIEKIDRMTQSKWKGTKIYIDSYKVSYQFRVAGRIFKNTDFIPVTAKNLKLLSKILKKESTICLVKFDTDDPNKSILVESE